MSESRVKSIGCRSLFFFLSWMGMTSAIKNVIAGLPSIPRSMCISISSQLIGGSDFAGAGDGGELLSLLDKFLRSRKVDDQGPFGTGAIWGWLLGHDNLVVLSKCRGQVRKFEIASSKIV